MIKAERVHDGGATWRYEVGGRDVTVFVRSATLGTVGPGAWIPNANYVMPKPWLEWFRSNTEQKGRS